MLERQPLDGKERQELEDLRRFKQKMLFVLLVLNQLDKQKDSVWEARLRIAKL